MCEENKNVIIKELETKLNDLKAQYAEKVEPVEKCICEHPIPSVLVAAGAGILIGVLIGKLQDR